MSFFYPATRTRAQITFYAQILQAAAIVLGGGWALWSYGQQLQAPYDEKQLSLYLEAARVTADLAKLPPGQDRDKAEQRFWELYWGELSFVESRVEDKAEASIEKQMENFCWAVFGKEKCKSDALSACVYNLSHRASDEIQGHWKPWRRLIDWSKKPECPESSASATSLPDSKLQ